MSMIAVLRIVTPAEIEGLESDPDAAADLVLAEDGPILDIEKSWDGLAFLLDRVGGAARLGVALLGGESMGDEVVYEPARLHRPDAVTSLAEQLTAVEVAQLREVFDPVEMAALDLYPSIWDEGEEALAYLLEHWEPSVAHYRRAADQGAGMLLAIV